MRGWGSRCVHGRVLAGCGGLVGGQVGGRVGERLPTRSLSPGSPCGPPPLPLPAHLLVPPWPSAPGTTRGTFHPHAPTVILTIPSLLSTCPHTPVAALAIGSRYNKSDLAIWVKIAACFAVVFVCWDLKFGEQAGRCCCCGGMLLAAAGCLRLLLLWGHALIASLAAHCHCSTPQPLSLAEHCQLGRSCLLVALPAPLRPPPLYITPQSPLFKFPLTQPKQPNAPPCRPALSVLRPVDSLHFDHGLQRPPPPSH